MSAYRSIQGRRWLRVRLGNTGSPDFGIVRAVGPIEESSNDDNLRIPHNAEYPDVSWDLSLQVGQRVMLSHLLTEHEMRIYERRGSAHPQDRGYDAAFKQLAAWREEARAS